MKPLPDVVRFYSDGTTERDRFDSAIGRLEWLRTQELISRLLPPAPARIIDVGGGPGTYASWLASLGHDVALYDATPALVAQARARASDGAGFSADVADARSIPEAEGSADVVLLLGPLYHLPDTADRHAALHEALRILKRGGVIAAAAIGRFTNLLDWARTGDLDDATAEYARTELRTTGRYDGRHGFTTAYFHIPSELANELEHAGFADVTVRAVEGPGWLLLGTQEADSEEPIATALRVARATEDEPSLMGASCHLLASGRRPTGERRRAFTPDATCT